MAFPMREQVEGIREIRTDQLLSREEAEYQAQFIPQWALRENSIDREVELKDFRDAVDFVNRVADAAQAEEHYPDVHIFEVNRVRLELFTRNVGGLTLQDFITASMIDHLV